jgi:acetyl esterase/lipase
MITIDPKLFNEDTIAPQTARRNDELRAWHAERPEPWDFPVEVLREARKAGASIFPTEAPDENARTESISHNGRNVEVRIIKHRDGKARGTYLHIHGGGWTWGAADEMDVRLREMSDECGLDCVSVEYRLAPENPYPAAPGDCETAALWLLEGEHDLGRERFFIGGESAGAHLSAVTLLRLRDRFGDMPFHGANLIAGCYDLGPGPGVLHWDRQRLILTRDDVQHFCSFYLPGDEDRRAPDISPLFGDLEGMPPALFCIGTQDILLDDNLQMAARWERQARNATFDIVPGGCHVFQAFRDLDITRKSDTKAFAFLKALM